jgi:hypothetical protein
VEAEKDEWMSVFVPDAGATRGEPDAGAALGEPHAR